MSRNDSPTKEADAARTLPPILTESPSAVVLLKALRRCWILATVLALGGGVLATAFAWVCLPASRFTAQSLLQVEGTPPWVVFHKGESKADFQSYQRTQVALVKSRLVLNTALRNPEVSNLRIVQDPIDPIAWLQKDLLVDFNLAPEILRIAMTGAQPEEIKVLVAKVTKAYLDEIVRREDGKRRERHQKLKELHENYQETLRTKRRTLRELIENIGTGDPATLALKQRFAQEQLAMEEKELLQAESELRKLHTELVVQKAKEQNLESISIPDHDLDELAKLDPVVAKYQARKLQLQNDINEFLRVSVRGEQELRIQQYRAEIATLDKSVAERAREIRPTLTTQLQARAQKQMKASLALLADRINMLEELKKNLTKDINRLALETRSLNKGSLDIESYKQELAHAEDSAKKIASELETMNLEMRAVPRITELESAFVTQFDDQKKRLALIIGAGLLGAFAVGAFMAWREHRSRRIQSPDEIGQGLQIDLLGTVPPRQQWGPLSVDGALAGPEEWTDPLDAIRALLLWRAQVEKLQVIMISSAVQAEGKTTLASQLALSLANAGRRTLLVDGDLRNPMIQRNFSIPAEPGLSEVLLQVRKFPEAIQESALPGLFLLPAGRVTAEALKVLSQKSLPTLLDDLRNEFDIIIVDTSPVIPVADALLIGQHVDAAILSALHNHTELHKLYDAHQALERMGIKVLGAVLNGVTVHSDVPTYRYLRPAPAPQTELSPTP